MLASSAGSAWAPSCTAVATWATVTERAGVPRTHCVLTMRRANSGNLVRYYARGGTRAADNHGQVSLARQQDLRHDRNDVGSIRRLARAAAMNAVLFGHVAVLAELGNELVLEVMPFMIGAQRRTTWLRSHALVDR